MLTRYVGGGGRPEEGQARFREAIAHFDFKVVGLAQSEWSREIGRTLFAAGYREDHSDDDYAVWVRGVGDGGKARRATPGARKRRRRALADPSAPESGRP